MIGLIWGVGLIAVAQEVGRELYSQHQLHWPSPWWAVFLFAGWIAAQQRVIRLRRANTAAVPSDRVLRTIDRFVSTAGEGAPIHIEAPMGGGETLQLHRDNAPALGGSTIQQPAAEAPPPVQPGAADALG